MIQHEDWGLIPYREAWDRQEALRAARANDDCPDTIIWCEHPRVFTTGRQDCRADWRASFAAIERAGIEIVSTNRGGRITYHGPGQLVGYFIMDLRARGIGVREFVRQIEALLIQAIAKFGVAATRDPIHPGVWVGSEKVAALGLHVSRGITQHGFALNYAPQLADYHYIVPCGIADRGVTSLAALTGVAPARPAVCATIERAAAQIFQDPLVPASPASKVSPAAASAA